MLANTLLIPGLAPLVGLPVVPAVGATFAPFIQVNQLTNQRILQLVQFYNYDFGIQPNELLVAIRVQKVLNWLTVDI